MGLGRFDHFAFCGLSNGNWTFARSASTSVLRTPCADRTILAVTSGWVLVPAGRGVALRWATSVAATNTPVQPSDAIRSGACMRRILAGRKANARPKHGDEQHANHNASH